MWLENLVYIIAFIISGGMTALGILTAIQLYQAEKKPVMAMLLYHQIFLFSFLIYSVWGNAALHLLLNDLQLSTELSSKLAFFFPMIGIPFMVVSWFMLLKFSILENGHTIKPLFAFLFFPVLALLVFLIDFLIYTGIIVMPPNATLFVIRILIALNLLIHLLFMLPFFISSKQKHLSTKSGFGKNQALFYLMTVIVYSAAMSFFNLFDYISEGIAIVLLFASGIFIPVTIRLNQKPASSEINMDFEAFCANYEISRREAEIILEICKGHSNKMIADRLFITLQTVKDHNHRIFTKTGVKSRVQLANLVREKTGN
ncbi:LuxR C-terminal-related transcriptional regulator [Maribellus sp. YY47]|uniref:response regulator transcription factor n=1 Tax=Maribellus sp. YY47 TaxID=2929486 RepID=UPI002000F473|nr:LuxR C-terminal-related transcriptional regulator [Maribellus sp. YY47]MCK3686061.1 LuxR C-terminal-related transcriptional regulator [Maribellus sp. YY47]